MVKKKNKKDKKTAKEKKKSAPSTSTLSIPDAVPASMTVASPVTDLELEKAWDTCAAAVTGWTNAIIVMQKAHAKASVSWLEVCRRALEFDTELLKTGCSYYKEVWHNACLQSAKHHVGAMASYVALQTDAFCDIQTDVINEYGRQWRRMYR